MGGGAGLVMHGNIRIVTEKAVFAMPEVSIGLFPGAGAPRFLSRLPGYFGEYLGLTGARIDDLLLLEDELCEVVPLDMTTISRLISKFAHKAHVKQGGQICSRRSAKDVQQIREEKGQFGKENTCVHFCLTAGRCVNLMPRVWLCIVRKSFANSFTVSKNAPVQQDSAYRRLEIINKCFSRKTVEEILLLLENEVTNQNDNWLVEAISSMKSASPTSLKVALRAIREGRTQTLEQCLIHDYTISCHMLQGSVNNDFYKGLGTMLFDKDNHPKWEPSKLELVTEEMIQQHYTKIEDASEWEFPQLPVRFNLITNRAISKL